MGTAAAPRSRRLFDFNGWLFVAPSLLLITTFLVYPIVDAFWMSLHSGKGSVVKFVGLGNVERLIDDPVFLEALKNTFIFLIVQVPLMIVLALIMATCLNMPKLKWRGLLRTAVFLPCVTSLVAYSVLFRSMFAYDGVVNVALTGIGIISEPISWLNDDFWARVVVILAITWRWTGYNMIFFLAAMQNIDRSIYEAARIDGISPVRSFLSLTVPMLKPVILFCTVTSTIGTLQLFDEVFNITKGGPSYSTTTLSLYIYNLSFKFVPNFGYAATVSYVIVVLSAILAFFQFYAVREKD